MSGRLYLTRRPVLARVRFGVFADLNGSSQYFYRSDSDFPESGITGANDITAQAWVNPASDQSKAILSKWDSTGGKRMFRFVLHTSGRLRASVHDGAGWVDSTSSSSAYTANIWQHIAYVYDASAGTVDFYVNGIFISQASGAKTTIADKDPDFRIGTSYEGAHSFYDGDILNVALFDDKRTPAEILASATDPTEDLSGAGNIIGQWMFNDAGAATFIDNTQGDAGRDLIPYDGGDTTFGNCGRTIGIIP